MRSRPTKCRRRCAPMSSRGLHRDPDSTAGSGAAADLSPTTGPLKSEGPWPAVLRRRRPNALFLTFWLIGSLLVAFMVLPLIGLGATQTGASLARVARMADVQQAIWLSIEASLITVAIAGFAGVPLAYVLARTRFPGKAILGAVIDLPLTVPHTVSGIALLAEDAFTAEHGEQRDAR